MEACSTGMSRWRRDDWPGIVPACGGAGHDTNCRMLRVLRKRLARSFLGNILAERWTSSKHNGSRLTAKAANRTHFQEATHHAMAGICVLEKISVRCAIGARRKLWSLQIVSDMIRIHEDQGSTK
jgi:hypothetical protein